MAGRSGLLQNAARTENSKVRTQKYLWRLLLLVGLIAAPFAVSSYWVGLMTQMIVFAILAMSLDILLGYTGLPSLGHTGIFGVAAYAIAILSTGYHASVWMCLVGGSWADRQRGIWIDCLSRETCTPDDHAVLEWCCGAWATAGFR